MRPSAWQRLRLLVRELGAATALLYGLNRLLQRINRHCGLHYYHFFAQPLADQPRLPPSRGQAFSFRVLHTYESVLDQLQRPAAVLRARFVQGAQCLVATRQEALVGCIWFIRDVYAEDEVRVDYRLPQDRRCVWDFDVFVTESQRLGVLFAKQWDAFDALLKPQGVRFTVCRINAFNQRSVASHRRLGAQDCGWALFFNWGARQWMVSSRRPFMAFGGRPVLQVGPSGAAGS